MVKNDKQTEKDIELKQIVQAHQRNRLLDKMHNIVDKILEKI